MLMDKKIILLIIALTAIMIISGCATKEPVPSSQPNKVVGGVIICGVDYPCGAQDKICPENYGAVCKVTDSDCKK
jgi:hypothetical protein